MSKNEEIVRFAQRGLAEAIKEMSRRCGGDSLDEQGLLLAAGNHPCPVLVNSVLRTGSLDANDVLRRAETFFAKREHGYETWIREGTDSDIEKAALDSGMRCAVELSGMVLHCNPDVPELSPGVEIRQVLDVQGLQEFTDVVAEGFRDEALGLSDLVRAIFAEAHSVIAPDTAAFVVWDQGVPSSAAMTIVSEGVAWIGWVTTRPEARGRGLGRLATAAATRAGFALGAKFASLEATKMGAPVYLRLGYREVVRYRTYWPANAFAWMSNETYISK